MLGTLFRRITISTLDAVVERGQSSGAPPVRWAAGALDQARGWVGLDVVQREIPLPVWTADHADRPMWDSDRQKLHKWRVDQGILQPDVEDASGGTEAAAEEPTAAIVVYYKRGCPYARAALDLLRERDYPFDAKDVKGDDATLSWLKIVTGHRTTPQIFVRGEAIGGYEQLRELEGSGALRTKLGDAVGDGTSESESEEEEIDVADLLERIADGAPVSLLDVRGGDEVRSGVIEGAVHVELDQLVGRAGELDAKAVWIVYCRSGVRSSTAAEVLRKAGFGAVASLRGGILAWQQAGGAVVPATGRPRRVGLPVVHPERSPFEDWAAAAGDDEAEVLEGDALIERVRQVLDECRPLVQADGGDIELLDVRDELVHLRLTGNCVGCPSAQATLRQGIERRLKARIPQIRGIASSQLTPS